MIRNTLFNLENYGFSYSNPGDYTATFVVKNATIEGSKEIVREIQISSLPE